MDVSEPVLDKLDLVGICKEYLGVQALKDINLSITKGTIHALVGQNGAGKSTLVKILSGAEAPSSGSVFLGGKEVKFHSPIDAHNHGIYTIYQELSLVPYLSVAENIFLGELPSRGPVVDWAKLYDQAKIQLANLGYFFDVKQNVERLSIAEQQVVELAKSLHRNAKILLLDEPTSALPPPDVDRLFKVLRKLAGEGMTLIYISHRIEELLELCDTITVLQDGKIVDSLQVLESKKNDVIEAMLPKSTNAGHVKSASSKLRGSRLGSGKTQDLLLSVRDLTLNEKIFGVNFDLHRGEVLGISGLVGSGHAEVASMLAGAIKISSGSIIVNGEKTNFNSPRGAIEIGIGLLPEDRKADGFIPDMSVTSNTTLASLSQFSKYRIMKSKLEIERSASMAQQMNMKITSVSQSLKTLSGGTQQKVIFSRWLVRGVKILVCQEPTRGVDVGAKESMYELIRAFANSGGTVIIASSEISEALMCDRVLVMSRGKLEAEFSYDEIDSEGQTLLLRFG
jgi:ribose transport system ATP-binding protein